MIKCDRCGETHLPFHRNSAGNLICNNCYNGSRFGCAIGLLISIALLAVVISAISFLFNFVKEILL